MLDKSNGYEENAAAFLRQRHPRIGAEIVRGWARGFQPGAELLELGCGGGEPISRVLVEEGLSLHAVDASPTLLGAFHARFPGVPTECAAAEESTLLNRTYDGAIAVGLIFLLAEETQRCVIDKVAHALRPSGRFLFSAPRQTGTWLDLLTQQESRSLGAAAYEGLLRGAGLDVSSGVFDEGENHYYSAWKASTG